MKDRVLRCGLNAWFGEYVSAEWTGAKKRSRHLVLWFRNHVYSAIKWNNWSYYQRMDSEFRYDFGKVLSTQNYPTHRSASTHCVLRLNLIKDMFNIASKTHIHTSIHIRIQHGIYPTLIHSIKPYHSSSNISKGSKHIQDNSINKAFN